MNPQQCEGSAAWLREVTDDEAFKKTLTVTCASCGRKLKAKQSTKRENITIDGRHGQQLTEWWRLPYHGTTEPMTKAEAQEQLPGYYLHHYVTREQGVWYAAHREMIPGFPDTEPTAVAGSWEHLVERVKEKIVEASK